MQNQGTFSAGARSADIRQYIQSKLKEDEPFMKLDSVFECAERCAQTFEDCFRAHRAELDDTKSRISFLSLPTSVRNHIYELVLIPSMEGEAGMCGETAIYVGPLLHDRFHDDTFKRVYGVNLDAFKTKLCWPTTWTLQPGLTKVSRQIRDETLSMFYGSNRFFFTCFGADENSPVVEPIYSPYLPVKSLHSWMACIGQKNMELLRNISIFLEHNVFFAAPSGASHQNPEDRVRRWLRSQLQHYDLTLQLINFTAYAWRWDRDGHNQGGWDRVYVTAT